MIIQNTSEEYHSGHGVSKSGLWQLYKKTPFHFKYGERKTSNAFDLGDAAHCAILEPEDFESRFYRGPDDRRGNKWKEAGDFCEHHKMTLLTSGDYDIALALRETAMLCGPLQTMLEGKPVIEHSAYHVDEETGVTVRCRPDIYNPTHKLIGDVKTAADGSAWGFQKAIGDFGYHVQEPIYTEIWDKAGGGEVEGFFFIVIEKSNPPMISAYELDAPAVAEGYEIYRKTLKLYAECERNDDWPGYPSDVQKISLRKFDYKLTEAPE